MEAKKQKDCEAEMKRVREFVEQRQKDFEEVRIKELGEATWDEEKLADYIKKYQILE